MTTEEANVELMKGPILVANGGVTPLASYRAVAEGLFFVQNMTKKSIVDETHVFLEPADQVNFVSPYMILNVAGKTFNIGLVDRLLAEKATEQ